jgi:hypothetical protein
MRSTMMIVAVLLSMVPGGNTQLRAREGERMGECYAREVGEREREIERVVRGRERETGR